MLEKESSVLQPALLASICALLHSYTLLLSNNRKLGSWLPEEGAFICLFNTSGFHKENSPQTYSKWGLGLKPKM